MKGNNFHFIAKSLESQRLIVRQSTIIKVEDASQNKHVISTNSLSLSRYAKDLNMTPQQRIEIRKPELLGSNEETNTTTKFYLPRRLKKASEAGGLAARLG